MVLVCFSYMNMAMGHNQPTSGQVHQYNGFVMDRSYIYGGFTANR